MKFCLKHIAGHRQFEADKRLIFQAPMIGFSLKIPMYDRATLRAMQGFEIA
jgi:hypothetical protein